MKKVLCSFMIFIILFNFIINSISYAVGTLDSAATYANEFSSQKAEVSDEGKTGVLEDGSVSQKQGSSARVSTSHESYGVTVIPTILGYVALLIDIIPLQIALLMKTMVIVSDPDPSATRDNSEFFFTIRSAVFNTVGLFYINFFDDGNTYTVSGETYTIPDANKNIRNQVSKYYYMCQLIAVAISLLTLIYIGIKMVISTIASDQARYKKMFIGWLESIILLFTMKYILSFIMELGRILLDIFATSALTSGDSFEDTIIDGMIKGILSGVGLQMAIYSLLFWILLFIQMKFFWLYFKRLLSVCFLGMIAPLITVTYPIDKAGDGKAQAFSAWMQEYIMNVLIQPLHALLYLIFVYTADEIAKFAPIVGVLFLFALGSSEKMVKKIFNMNNLSSMNNLDDFLEKMKPHRKGK